MTEFLDCISQKVPPEGMCFFEYSSKTLRVAIEKEVENLELIFGEEEEEEDNDSDDGIEETEQEPGLVVLELVVVIVVVVKEEEHEDFSNGTNAPLFGLRRRPFTFTLA
jgi:hypothetical protein